MEPATIIKEAREWVGTPFHHQGRHKQVGVDCIGVIQGTGRNLGLLTYDRKNYSYEPAFGELEKELENNLIRTDALMPGCILLMRFIKEPQHVGLFTDINTLIHAYSSVGKCVEHTLDDKWKKRIIATYRFKEMRWRQ